ncbi:MAG: T9SS type A sorting domain-containing protein [Candidatus Latescibacteria bacterium]|nr:T9SS type A sorting domain-containing protein [Candidatus Latescibacterota bacterium]
MVKWILAAAALGLSPALAQDGPNSQDARWQHVGPFGEEWNVGVKAVALSVQDVEALYVLAENGVWRSWDGGRAWERTGLMVPSHLGVFTLQSNKTLLVDAADADKLYWGWAIEENLRSGDAGATWEDITTVDTNLLAADLGRGGRLYAEREDGLHASDDGGRSWRDTGVPLQGFPFIWNHPAAVQTLYAGSIESGFAPALVSLFRSNDGGDTWRRIEGARALAGLAADAAGADRLYGVDEEGIWHTDDGGVSWQRVGDAPDNRIEEFVFPLVGLAASGDRLFAWGRFGPLWRSVDGGRNWTRGALENIETVVPHPADPDLVYLVTHKSIAPGALYRSVDGGAEWERVSIVDTRRTVETLSFDGQGQLLAGSGRQGNGRLEPELYRLDADGRGWTQLIEAVPQVDILGFLDTGIGIGAIDLVEWDRHTDGFLAHTVLGFFLGSDDGQSWVRIPAREITAGFGAHSPVRRPQIVAAPERIYLYEPQNRGLYLGTGVGGVWAELRRDVWALVYREIDLTGRVRVYAAIRNQLWSSNDGADWQRQGAIPGLTVFDLEVHPGEQGFIYAASLTGLHASNDEGATWYTLWESETALTRARIRLDPDNQDRLFLVTGRQLLASSDGGATWTDLDSQIPGRVWCNDVLVDKANPELVYVATSAGVFAPAAATTAVEEGDSLPSRFAVEEIYPNPFNSGTTIRVDMPTDGRVRIVVFNAAGQRVKTVYEGFVEAGYFDAYWRGVDDSGASVATGVYFLRVITEHHAETKKMALVR